MIYINNQEEIGIGGAMGNYGVVDEEIERKA
jgi:hypothetical protein